MNTAHIEYQMRNAHPDFTEDLWAEIERMLLDRSPAASDALEDMSLMDIIKVASAKRAKHELKFA